MEIPILNDIVIILGLAFVVIFICRKIRIPTIVGFLLTGVVAGPHGLRLVTAVEQVETLAQIGVILLLFTIGLELSLTTLSEARVAILAGGSLQVVLTAAMAASLAVAIGAPLSAAILIGFVVSLSSTAIVLKLIQDRAEVSSPHGRSTVGMLVFQDIAVVPMMLVIPLLAGGGGSNTRAAFLPYVIQAAAIVVLVFIGARWVIPHVLYQAARLRDRELFLLSVVLVGLATAWLTSSVGLSLALGAFLAGLIISESEYSHRALGDILPFRDIFSSFFFVSIGMLLDVGFVGKYPVQIVSLSLAVIVGKSLLAALSTSLLGFPLRTALLVGLSLAQVGEFSFVLLMRGMEHNLLTGEMYQFLLAVSVATMLATPFVVAAAPSIAAHAARLPLAARSTISPASQDMQTEGIRDHLVIIGFGLNGQNLARAASAAAIPYVIIEMNPQTVRSEKKRGQPIIYGDATQEAVLKHACVADARVVVIAISDAAATRRIVASARTLNATAQIVARTRFVAEMEPLYRLGASEVIPEEFETSVEIFTRVLATFLVPRDVIVQFTEKVRADGYRMLRSVSIGDSPLADLKKYAPDLEISVFRVKPSSAVAGKSLAETDLRKLHGLSVLAIRRNSELLANPAGETCLAGGDVVIVLGAREKIASAAALFGAEEEKLGMNLRDETQTY